MEYPKRETLEARLFDGFKRRVLERFGAGKRKKSAGKLIQKIYLDSQEGCLPDEFIGDELLYSIQSKFYEFFASITEAIGKDFLEKQGIKRTWISIWIDPSYNEETHVVVTFESAALLIYSREAWNFSWPSPAALKKEMADLYFRIRDGLNTYFWEGIRYERGEK